MTNARMTDMVGMEGFLSIYLTPEGSDRKIPWHLGPAGPKNKITDAAREHLLRLAVGGPVSVSANPITEFRIGNGGTGQIVTGAEIGLYNEIDPIAAGYDPTDITRSFVLLPTPNNRIVDLIFTLDNGEANGETIDEVGLFAANGWMGDLGTYGRMFNIKNFPAILKTSGFTISFIWRINFSGTC